MNFTRIEALPLSGSIATLSVAPSSHPSGDHVAVMQPNMYYVYLLKSTRYDWKYIGVTADLRVRVRQHNSGEVFSTKARAPYRLIYYEAYASKADARAREYRLKHHSQAKELLLAQVASSLQ